MSWDAFIWFAVAALLLWVAGAFFAWKGREAFAFCFTLAGIAVFFSYIICMWVALERPPMLTMGETRLWYSLFLPVAGIIVYGRWRYKWILSFSTLLAAVFISVNIFRPEIHSKELAEVLRSPWFAPHVIVYMFAYAMLGAAAVMAVYLLFIKRLPVKPAMTEDERLPVKPAMTEGERLPVKPAMTEGERLPVKPAMTEGTPAMTEGTPAMTGETPAMTEGKPDDYKPVAREMNITDNLVYVGVAFLTLGMMMGALWAREAWGSFWTWDPKETWAAATWLCYLVYIHLRRAKSTEWQLPCALLLIAFVCLQICWWGINYLPSAAGSVHIY